MEHHQPSRTAQGAALHRAAHQLLDRPLVFEDPLVLRMVGAEAEAALRSGTDPHSGRERRGLRAFLVVRSRYSEDCLSEAYARGVHQYVLLGAGLDTFAYRAAAKFPELKIFEVDHPATQGWKRARLAQERVAIPRAVVYTPVDFERETLADGLARAGFETTKPALFAWLGVVPYLTDDAVKNTLRFIAQTMPQGSAVIFDYSEPADWHNAEERAAFQAMAERVAQAGEPFRSFYRPEELSHALTAMGFSQTRDLDATELNARYFSSRDDGMRLGGRGHLMHAVV
ncbi:MAG: class I SAM-dependent methyltransferase [Proteobacteria bacterium]|nr:class I SAM-dependent methyltransferase [Pseudomonadota bacterium]